MLVALTFHAEMLFDDRVWSRVRQMLRWLQRYTAYVTFFTMAPYHERCRPKDESIWLSRLRFIEQEGHQIGLHTHFYKDDYGKEISFSKERVSFLIQRDASYFRQHGFQITGFAGGGWILDPNVYLALLQNKFTHDCTAHMFEIDYVQSRGHHLVTSKPFWVQEGDNGLLEIPTNALLSSAIKSSMRNLSLPHIETHNARYSLIYLHDYDLLRPMARYSFLYIVAWQALCKCQFVTTSKLGTILQNEDLETCSIEEIGQRSS